jgi:hypothetical protein
MRVIFFSTIALAVSTASVAAPVPRPQLSNEPIFFVSELTDIDPSSSADDETLYGSLQTLVEQFGVTGVIYEDKRVHKDWTITADEAKTLLLSTYQTLTSIGDAALESELAQTSDDDTARVIRAYNAVFEKTLSSAPACRLLVGTKYAVAAKKKPQAPKGNANVSWAQALACLPGSVSMPLTAQSYNRSAAKLTAPITRGEFLHKLNEAVENGYSEIGGAGS